MEIINNFNSSEKAQIEYIKRYSFNIRNIDNPSEKVQLEALEQNINCIGPIKNISIKVIEDMLKTYSEQNFIYKRSLL